MANPSPMTAGRDDDARLWRVVDVFRFGAIFYALAIFAGVYDDYRRPWPALAVLLVLLGWTVLLAVRPGREPAIMIIDLIYTASAVISTRILDDPQRIQNGASTLPSIWSAGVVLGWAIWRGWRGGLFAAVVVCAADLVEVGRFSQVSANSTISNIVLLLLAGLVVGYATEVIRTGRAQMAEAVAREAATTERERLARDIHDSVLQVLGYVHREGAHRGGSAAELARLAGEQEVRLRALISNGPVELAAGGAPGRAGLADLRAALSQYAGEMVVVSCPAEPVELPSEQVQAVRAAVGAALDNVRRHAGYGARAWLLLEDEPDQVTVTVRDDGPGVEAARLEAAREQGRLGVSASIRGRILDIGGTVDIVGRPGEGTEVEIRVPRSARAGSSRSAGGRMSAR
jgi:signal transduction histidine kinase